MSNTEKYRQCLLYKERKMMVSWIPLKFAKSKKILRLKVDGEWDDGWQVVTQYGQIITEPTRIALSSQYANWRKVTDV